MSQLRVHVAALLTTCLCLVAGCGQGGMLQGASDSSRGGRSSVSKDKTGGTIEGEGQSADQPQSVAGAYLTCAEYEPTKVDASGKVVSVGCKVSDKTGKRVPLSKYPDREWRVTDDKGQKLPDTSVKMTEPANNPAGDILFVITADPTQGEPKVEFRFDKKPDTNWITTRIPFNPGICAINKAFCRCMIEGKWLVTRTQPGDLKLGTLDVKLADDGESFTASAFTDFKGEGGFSAPANTVLFTGVINLSAGIADLAFNIELKKSGMIPEPGRTSSPKLKWGPVTSADPAVPPKDQLKMTVVQPFGTRSQDTEWTFDPAADKPSCSNLKVR